MLAVGEIGPARNRDPSVTLALVHGTTHAKVEARREAASGPQVEEEERSLEARAQAARWEQHRNQFDIVTNTFFVSRKPLKVMRKAIRFDDGAVRPRVSII